MNRRTQIVALVGSVAVIAILGALAVRRHEAPPVKQVAIREAPSYWYDPMHPRQHFDKPGKSPFMDMQLVPKFRRPRGQRRHRRTRRHRDRPARCPDLGNPSCNCRAEQFCTCGRHGWVGGGG